MEDGLLKILILFFLILGQGCQELEATELNSEKSIVFGPGIDPKRSSLPINYFYIQAVDKHGNNLTDFDESSLSISIESPQKVRYRTETLNLGDGLLFYQYRIFSETHTLAIHIRHKGRAIAQSPYQLGPLMHENCACPLRSPVQWLEDFNCPAIQPQIANDLKTFRAKGVNVTEFYDTATEMFSRSSMVHYSIVDGKLYARTFGSIVGFKFLSDMILLSVTNKVVLPDMELMVNLGDWPLSKVKKGSPPFPMFSWCGSGDTWDIIWPTWDLMKSTIMGMDRVSLSILTAQRSLGHPRWEDRDPRVFFRGRDSNQARLDLIRDHHGNSELFDVGITAWFFFQYDENVYGPKAERVGFHDFFKYKYQINIDGTVAAYRLPYLLAGGSLVLKQDSSYYEHFYHQLEPWEHYIPLHRNISDVLERVEWARENDDQDYGQLMVGTPKIHDGMEPVAPEVPRDCTAFCEQIRSSIHKIPREEL
ncbi:protein O-glucosyltransferase 2-like isoform X2 [Halichondria panicea]|uniref:protein O-glucosyltransferase 2-like isoform X2 n=1 Tax=Halichondria panicea TaxID=6063 RepID=UPI00312B4F9B